MTSIEAVPGADATWLVRLDADGDGPRLAVKDCIDVVGTVTTVGCPAIAEGALAATADAPVVATARAQGAQIVGKTNLVELCRHADGVNEWTGTPENPLDASRIPGGSSSGSAVAVARGEADVAYGTDTGGSVRVPAACCGIAGLKTTAGRVPTHGVFEFSRTLDTVGPMAADVAGLELGMRLLEPGFTAAATYDGPPTVARVRLPKVDPVIETALDEALAAAGLESVPVELPDWDAWVKAANDLMGAEGHLAHRYLLDRAEKLEDRHAADIAAEGEIPAARVVECRRLAETARGVVEALVAEHGAIALPTLRLAPPRYEDWKPVTYTTVPFNFTGSPAVSLPVPGRVEDMPVSLQLVGARYAEEQLLALARTVEAALR